MFSSLQPTLPSASDFCRQMLLNTKQQLSYEDERQEPHNDNLSHYLELIKELCGMIAERFGMRREEVLQFLRESARREDSEMNIFIRDLDAPLDNRMSPRPSDGLSDLTSNLDCMSGRAAKRKRGLSACPITPESLFGSNVDSSHLANDPESIEAFFARHPALDRNSAVVCTTILRRTGMIDSLKRLHEVLEYCRGQSSRTLLDTAASCARIWKSLQTSDVMMYTAICLRRVYLWQLFARDRQLRSHGSNSKRARDIMMSEIFDGRDYPSSGMRKDNRKKLRNYVAAGRKWDRLVSEYNIVLVMVVVTGRGTGVNSQDIEHLKNDQIEALIQGFHRFRDRLVKPMCDILEGYVMDILQGRSPTYHPKFANIEWQSLGAQNPSDEEILGLCQLE